MNARLQAWLLQLWQSRGLPACLLWPLSRLYGWAQGHTARLEMRRAERLPAVVLVVGNVIAGGAGKTPLTLTVLEHLHQRGLKAGVISRGHGRKDGGTRAVDSRSSAAQVGDEPLLIWRRAQVPVWVARQRAQAGRALLQAHPEVQVIVCDDGLQHLALARDIEICVMDDRGIGNGWLLPAGPLREPWPRQTDLLVHAPGQVFAGGHAVQRHLLNVAMDGHGQRWPLQRLQGRPVDALAGIARPQVFFDMLQQQGLTLRRALAMADHAPLQDWQPPSDDTPVLCTEKDAVKLWPRWPQVLAVPLSLSLPEAFFQALDARLDAALADPSRKRLS
jgi:tetraacyldisaccharide 4'-kinase